MYILYTLAVHTYCSCNLLRNLIKTQEVFLCRTLSLPPTVRARCVPMMRRSFDVLALGEGRTFAQGTAAVLSLHGLAAG